VSWGVLLWLAAGTYLMRLTGIMLRDRLTVPAQVERYLDLGATALLAALVATAALTDGHGFAGWARPAGVLVGALLAWRRMPFVLIVVIAATTTATLRFLGIH
jgi:branched-subunit amino acid transport protein